MLKKNWLVCLLTTAVVIVGTLACVSQPAAPPTPTPTPTPTLSYLPTITTEWLIKRADDYEDGTLVQIEGNINEIWFVAGENQNGEFIVYYFLTPSKDGTIVVLEAAYETSRGKQFILNLSEAIGSSNPPPEARIVVRGKYAGLRENLPDEKIRANRQDTTLGRARPPLKYTADKGIIIKEPQFIKVVSQ